MTTLLPEWSARPRMSFSSGLEDADEDDAAEDEGPAPKEKPAALALGFLCAFLPWPPP